MKSFRVLNQQRLFTISGIAILTQRSYIWDSPIFHLTNWMSKIPSRQNLEEAGRAMIDSAEGKHFFHMMKKRGLLILFDQ